MVKKFLVVLLVGCAVAAPAIAQNETYVELTYMKARSSDYPQVETDLWKPIHQERIRRGEMLNWSVYAVRFGDAAEYDYVTVNVYDSIDDVEGLDSLEDLVAAAVPDKSVEDVMATLEMRDVVRSELWVFLDQVASDEAGAYAPYVEVGFMNVPFEATEQYLNLERDLWKPIHEETLGTGGKTGWALFSLALPYGTDYPYNHATTSYYSALEAGGLPFQEAAAAAHPNMSWESLTEQTLQSRDLVKGELWVLVDSAE